MLNPDKFQFAERIVDFAGFRVSDSTIEPLPKYLDAFRHFPSPTSTTNIRSWFVLVNQVANYAQLRDIMEPFKPFLSPRCKFFDMRKRTCLRPDWCTRGIGYFLLQQHYSCPSSVPDCCPGGWRIALAGSRFLTPAEQRYAAIECEALAVAWGLEQTRYFTQGCDNLVVITDHKPLVKIFADRTLDEIHGCSNSPIHGCPDSNSAPFPCASTSSTLLAKPTTPLMQRPGTLPRPAQYIVPPLECPASQTS